MNNIRDYICAVVGIAVCCGIIKKLTLAKGAPSAVISAFCGIAVTIVTISPVVSVKIPQLGAYTASVQAEADRYVQNGKDQSRSQLKSIILQQTHTYIQDKAVALDCNVDISIQLSDDPLPTPVSVIIDGRFSPYAKVQLSQGIASDLGIPKEMQQWNYKN